MEGAPGRETRFSGSGNTRGHGCDLARPGQGCGGDSRGRCKAREVTEGSVVEPASARPLCSVSSRDPGAALVGTAVDSHARLPGHRGRPAQAPRRPSLNRLHNPAAHIFGRAAAHAVPSGRVQREYFAFAPARSRHADGAAFLPRPSARACAFRAEKYRAIRVSRQSGRSQAAAPLPRPSLGQSAVVSLSEYFQTRPTRLLGHVPLRSGGRGKQPRSE